MEKFSDDSYTIFFVKNPRGPNGDGSVFEIYSVKSDGSSLTFVKDESSATWQNLAFSNGVIESMGKFYGDLENSTGDKKLVVESGWFGGWFAFFSTPKLYLVENDQQTLLMRGGFVEMEWLPDGRRIVFSNGSKIGLIDTESKKVGLPHRRCGLDCG